MSPLSGLGIGLSVLFGCFFLGLVLELYYLLWWKNKRPIGEEDRRKQVLKLLLCWRRPSSVHNNSSSSSRSSMRERDPDGQNPDQVSVLKTFGEESVESELMRLHNLSGPPRFLFTIKEETKEDLETDSVKSRQRRSLGDLIMAVESPFVTPMASPMKPSPLGGYSHHGVNPLFESSVSPPPKFKFLRDAEDKLYRRLKLKEEEEEEEEMKRVSKNVGSASVIPDNSDGSFVAIVVAKTNHSISSSSQVLPLSSSPTTVHQKPSVVH